jgi:hypothetical protein
MLGISKRGDCYVRKLLVHGARVVIRVQQNKASPEAWLGRLLARRHANVVAVALANKNARAYSGQRDRRFRSRSPEYAASSVLHPPVESATHRRRSDSTENQSPDAPLHVATGPFHSLRVSASGGVRWKRCAAHDASP